MIAKVNRRRQTIQIVQTQQVSNTQI
jgi:hypothetical protein